MDSGKLGMITLDLRDPIPQPDTQGITCVCCHDHAANSLWRSGIGSLFPLLLCFRNSQSRARISLTKEHVDAGADRSGMHSDDGVIACLCGVALLRSAIVKRHRPRSARLSLTEGRYHQVRRMFAAVGNHVEALHRRRIGGLTLCDLPSKAWRVLDAARVADLFTNCDDR